MAHHSSAVRQNRRSLRRNIVNRKSKSSLRTQVKKIREAIKANNKEEAAQLLPQTFSLIDKTVKKGAIHANKGSRYKSRLSRQVVQLNASPSTK